MGTGAPLGVVLRSDGRPVLRSRCFVPCLQLKPVADAPFGLDGVGVGIQGIGAAEGAYQHALSYALDRKQGRTPVEGAGSKKRVKKLAPYLGKKR